MSMIALLALLIVLAKLGFVIGVFDHPHEFKVLEHLQDGRRLRGLADKITIFSKDEVHMKLGGISSEMNAFHADEFLRAFEEFLFGELPQHIPSTVVLTNANCIVESQTLRVSSSPYLEVKTIASLILTVSNQGDGDHINFHNVVAAVIERNEDKLIDRLLKEDAEYFSRLTSIDVLPLTDESGPENEIQPEDGKDRRIVVAIIVSAAAAAAVVFLCGLAAHQIRSRKQGLCRSYTKPNYVIDIRRQTQGNCDARFEGLDTSSKFTPATKSMVPSNVSVHEDDDTAFFTGREAQSGMESVRSTRIASNKIRGGESHGIPTISKQQSDEAQIIASRKRIGSQSDEKISHFQDRGAPSREMPSYGFHSTSHTGMLSQYWVELSTENDEENSMSSISENTNPGDDMSETSMPMAIGGYGDIIESAEKVQVTTLKKSENSNNNTRSKTLFVGSMEPTHSAARIRNLFSGNMLAEKKGDGILKKHHNQVVTFDCVECL